MAIILFGSASNPADNGTGITAPVVITPPGSMQTGDLVFVTVCFSGTSGTLTVSETGGQTWTSLTTRNQTRNRMRSFYCIFNGTWGASPSWTGSGTSNVIARMLVFRPNGGTTSTWGVDVAEVSAVYAAPTTPFTVSIAQITTIHAGALVIAGWTSADDNTWGSLTAGWTALSPAQVRNTSTTYQQSETHAWEIKASPGATGAVAQNQATLGGDAGTKIIMAFYEIESHSGTAAITGNGVLTGATQKGGKGSALTSGGGILAALAVVGMLGTGTISGNGLQTATGRKAGIVSAIISGGGTLAATGEKGIEQHSGAGIISGGGAIISEGKKSAGNQGAVSGGGTVSSEGVKGGQVSTVVSGGGSLVGSGLKTGIASPVLSGTGSLLGVATKQAFGSSSISVQGHLVASGVHFELQLSHAHFIRVKPRDRIIYVNPRLRKISVKSRKRAVIP